MKRAFQVLLFFVVLVAVAVGVFFTINPSIGKVAEIQLPTDPARIEHGKYMAEHVSMCIDCHSQRDWTVWGAPTIEDSRGAGGEEFKGEFGVLYAPNITPAGIGDYTDQQLYLAVTAGISPKKGSLFPLMPYHNYGKMDINDIEDILAYIRTLPSKNSEPKASKLAFPLNLIVRTMPTTPHHQTKPPVTDSVKYGEYLLNAAACAECHTPKAKGQPVEGYTLAGGFKIDTPAGPVTSANLTPHESGLKGWTKERFIQRFKGAQQPHNRGDKIADGQVPTVMPWCAYSGMTEQDLGALYDYLQTVKPVETYKGP